MQSSSSHKPTVRARISLAGARAAYVGPGLNRPPHRNAAATLAIALERPFILSVSPDGRAEPTGSEEELCATLIPPGTLHHLSTSGPMLFLYLDALSDDLVELESLDLELARLRLIEDQIADFNVEQIVAKLGLPQRPWKQDPLTPVVRRLDASPQDFHSVIDAAEMAGLSASWFQARFRRAVGVPFRRYRLWRRMAVVMTGLAQGETLTQAAHGAGFSSSAHLSDTFRKMFGLSPSDLLAQGIAFDIANTRTSLTERGAA